jgi:pyrophosphatase PpaX
LSRNVDAVIFDFDGTLADTIPVIVRAWNAAVHEPLGRAFTTAEVISRFGIPDPEMIRKEVGPDAAAHAIEVYFHEYERQHDIVAAFDGIPELLCKLQQSRLPIGLNDWQGSPDCGYFDWTPWLAQYLRLLRYG